MLPASACGGRSMLVLAFRERAAVVARAAGRSTNKRKGTGVTSKRTGSRASSSFLTTTFRNYARLQCSNLSRATNSEQLASGEAQLRTVSARWGSRAPVFPPLPAQKSPQAQASISAPPASTSGKISS